MNSPPPAIIRYDAKSVSVELNWSDGMLVMFSSEREAVGVLATVQTSRKTAYYHRVMSEDQVRTLRLGLDLVTGHDSSMVIAGLEERIKELEMTVKDKEYTIKELKAKIAGGIA